jgi:hypothetical protein
MPSDVDLEGRWRTLALEARALAAEIANLDAKRIMLSIADGYELLARHAKARKDRQKAT